MKMHLKMAAMLSRERKVKLTKEIPYLVWAMRYLLWVLWRIYRLCFNGTLLYRVSVSIAAVGVPTTCCLVAGCLLGDLEKNQTDVDGASCQNFVAFRHVSEWQKLGVGLQILLGELSPIDDRVHFSFTIRTTEHGVVQWQRIGQLGFKNQLVVQSAVEGLWRVLHIITYTCFHYPLHVEGTEAGRLIEQLRDEVIWTVWPQLEVCKIQKAVD